MRTILIQGAMDVEIDKLIEFYSPQKQETIAGFEFWIAEYKGARIVISKTKIGIINCTQATTIAVLKFEPDVVINQGCAGGAVENLGVGDMVIGESAVYINDFKPPEKGMGEGSNSLEWVPNPKRSYLVESSPELIEVVKTIGGFDKFNFGVLGSGDVFTRERDRICYLTSLFNHLCEDMETIAAFKTCEDFKIKRIGFRVISNNELTGEKLDKSTTKLAQDLTIKFVDKILKI